MSDGTEFQLFIYWMTELFPESTITVTGSEIMIKTNLFVGPGNTVRTAEDTSWLDLRQDGIIITDSGAASIRLSTPSFPPPVNVQITIPDEEAHHDQ